MSKVSSWFARSQDALSHPEVVKRLENIEHALELQYLGKPQAEIDGGLASAVAELITSLNETRAAAIQIGSLLIVKVGSTEADEKILVRHLTPQELALLHQDPELLSSPSQILKTLGDRTKALPAAADAQVP